MRYTTSRSPRFAFLLACVLVVGASGLLWALSQPGGDQGRPALQPTTGDFAQWYVDVGAGENYFSLPVLPLDLSWGGLFGRWADGLDEVAAWDAGGATWRRFLPQAPEASESGDVPSLIFRAVARRPTRLWFEGKRFVGDVDRYMPLAERLRMTTGWNFLPGAFDEPMGRSALVGVLQAQSNLSPAFDGATDTLKIWDAAAQQWAPVPESYTGQFQPGAVFLACRAVDQARDPYQPSGSAERGSALQGSTLANVSSNASSLNALAVAGDDFAFGPFQMSGHSYDKNVQDDKPEKGRCRIRLPDALLGFTNLPTEALGTISYTKGGKIQKVALEGITEVVVAPGSDGSRTVSDIDELFITADGTLFGEGKLLQEATSNQGTAATTPAGPLPPSTPALDLDVRLVWNAEWPSIHPTDFDSETKDGVTKHANKEVKLPALEIETLLGEDAMACLRWWKDSAGAVGQLKRDADDTGWRLSFTGERKRLRVQQVGYDDGDESAPGSRKDLDGGMRAVLSAVNPPSDGKDEHFPFFVAPKVTRANSTWRTMGADLAHSDVGIPLAIYQSGLATLFPGEDWRLNLMGDTADFERRFNDKFSIHLQYGLSAETEDDGPSELQCASLTPAIYFDGHDFGQVKHLVGALTFRLELSYESKNSAGGSGGYRTGIFDAVKRMGQSLSKLCGGTAGDAQSGADIAKNFFDVDATDGTVVGLHVTGLGQFALGELDSPQEITSLVDLDLSWFFEADAASEAKDKGTTHAYLAGWKRTVQVGAMVSFDQVVPQDVPKPATLGAAGAKVRFTWSQVKANPEKKLEVSAWAKVNVSQDLALTESGSPSVDMVASYTREWWPSDRLPFPLEGGTKLIKQQFELSAASNFLFKLPGGCSETELELPSGDNKKIPTAEAGLNADQLRIVYQTEKTDTDVVRSRELDFLVSGAYNRRTYTVDPQTGESTGESDVTYAFFGMADVNLDPGKTFKQRMDDSDFMFVLDMNHPIIGNRAKFTQVLLARVDHQVSVGVTLQVKTAADRWCTITVLPSFTSTQDWSVLLAVEDLAFSEDVAFSDAFLKFGKTSGKWDVAFGGTFEVRDIDEAEQMNLQIGGMVAFLDKKVSLFLRLESGKPQLGTDKLGLSFKQIAGSYDWGAKVLSVTLDWDLYCQFLLRQGAEDLRPPAIGMALNITKTFGLPPATGPNAQRSYSFAFHATRLIDWPFKAGEALNECGGFRFDSLDLKRGTGCWDIAGTATLFTPRAWRELVTDNGFVGLAMPESATASVRSVGGLSSIEVSAAFSDTIGLQLFDDVKLGIKSFYFRKASPWTMKAGAALEWGSGEGKKSIGGVIGHESATNKFEFRPDLGEKPLELKIGDVTFSISAFVLSARKGTATVGKAPWIFSIAGTTEVSGGILKEPLRATILLEVGTDKSITVALTNCTGLQNEVVDNATFSITAHKVMKDGTEKWEVVMVAAATFTVPDEIPLLGGKQFRGCFTGDAPDGDFMFSVAGIDGSTTALDPLAPLISIPVLGSMGDLNFSQLGIGRETVGGNKKWAVSATAQLVLYPPASQFFGAAPGEAFKMPGVKVSLAGGQLCVEALIVNPPGFGCGFGLGKLGEVTLALKRLYLSSAPSFGAEGGMSITGDYLDFSANFTVDYNPLSNACSFMVNLPNPLELGLAGIAQMSLSKVGYRSLILGMMGVEASFTYEIGNMLYGYGFIVKDLLYLTPNSVPPFGFPFFEEIGLKLSFLGFSGAGSVSLPAPQIPSVLFAYNFFKKTFDAFKNDDYYYWEELTKFLKTPENREQVERMFKGPGLGNAYFLLPYLLKPALPDLEEVEEEIFLIGTFKRLKFVLLDKIWYATDLARLAGLDWPDVLVTMFKVFKGLILAFVDPKKIINLVPEDKRYGRVNFEIEGFLKFDIGYHIKPDEIIYAREQVDGVKEFCKFNKLATWVEETYPTLKSIAAKSASPVTTTFGFTDPAEGWSFKGNVKDTFVNLKETMLEATRLRGILDTGAPEFDERAAFVKHLTYLVDAGAQFTPKVDEGGYLAAKVSASRTSELRLMGVSKAFRFEDPSKSEVYFEGTLPFYATYSGIMPKDSAKVVGGIDPATGTGRGQTADLLKKLQEEAAAAVGTAQAAQQAALAAAATAEADAVRLEDASRTAKASLDKAVADKADAQRLVDADLEAQRQKASAEYQADLESAAGDAYKSVTAKIKYDRQVAAIKVNTALQKRLDDATAAEVKALAAEKEARDKAAKARALADRLCAEAVAKSAVLKQAQLEQSILAQHMANLRQVLVTSHVEMKDGSLVLVTDASVRDLVSQTVLFQGRIPDQPIYETGTRFFSSDCLLIGFKISHALDDQGYGRLEFTDYGTMKVSAPLTVVTYQFPGSKLNKLRDALDYVARLPVFDYDSNPFLLATHFWVNLMEANPAAEKRSIQGSAIRALYNKKDIQYSTGDELLAGEAGGATEQGAEEASFEVLLRLEDLQYNNNEGATGEDGAPPQPDSQRLSVTSDISSFYETARRLKALPFKVTYTGPGGAGNAEEVVDGLTVLDGSPEVSKKLLEQRDAAKKARIESLLDMWNAWGLTPDGQPLAIKRVTMEIHDGYLMTQVRPRLVSVVNMTHGAEMLRLVEGDQNQIDKLMTGGPYGDPASYPTREQHYFIECRGFQGDTKLNTPRDSDLVKFFEQDLLLREVDLTSPTGLIAGDVWQGSRMDNHVEARKDGLWQGGVRVPNFTENEGIRRFMTEGDKVFLHLVTPTNKPVKIVRRFRGDVAVQVERAPGIWEESFIEHDATGHVDGRIRYPTGEVIPGGFKIWGALALGNAQALRGEIDFSGEIKNDGDFHFEGGCQIWVLGKDVASARFIIDRQDGLYICGKIDAAIARVFIEGRLRSDWFELHGELDARLGGFLGVRASLTINPSLFEMRGDVFMAGKKMFSGLIRITGDSFDFCWGVRCGRIGADATITFRASKDGNGKITSWFLSIRGRVWVKLWWPFGRPSLSFGFSIDSNGNFRVYFWKLYVQVNIVRFSLDWGWD